jgi:hypothetical protein
MRKLDPARGFNSVGDEPSRILKVIQPFGKHCSCHLQGECVLVGCFSEALKRAGGRWRARCDKQDYMAQQARRLLSQPRHRVPIYVIIFFPFLSTYIFFVTFLVGINMCFSLKVPVSQTHNSKMTRAAGTQKETLRS